MTTKTTKTNVTTNKKNNKTTTTVVTRPKQASTTNKQSTNDKQTTDKPKTDTTIKSVANNNLFKLYSIQHDNKKNDTVYSTISWEKFKKDNSIDIDQKAQTTTKGCQLNSLDKNIKQLINLYTYINNNRLTDTKVYKDKIKNLKKDHKLNYKKDTDTFNVEKYQTEYIRLKTEQQSLATEYNAILDIVLLMIPTNYTQYQEYTKECNNTNYTNYYKSLALIMNKIGIVPNDTVIQSLIFYINHKVNKNSVYKVENDKRTRLVKTNKIKDYQLNLLYAISELLLQNDIININYTMDDKYIANIKNQDILDLYDTTKKLMDIAKKENKKKAI